MNRPISGSDFGYEIPLKESTQQYIQKITGINNETLNTNFSDKKQLSLTDDGYG